MKKLLYLLLLLPLGFLASCSDDDDLPNVNLSVDLNNVAVYDNTVYAVRGENMEVTALNIEGLGGKKAIISNATYFLNAFNVAFAPVAPFAVSIDTGALPNGKNLLAVDMDVAQVGKPLGWASIEIPFVLVADKASLPDGAELGTATLTYQNTPAKKK